MNTFSKGFWLTIFLTWAGPALITRDYHNVGPALALIHLNGFWCLFLLIIAPIIGGYLYENGKTSNTQRGFL